MPGSTVFKKPLRPVRLMTHGGRQLVWHRFGMWLILGLEFVLAADIVRTAISPTWEQTGQLAAIAIIRTFLNYFLEKDVANSPPPHPGIWPVEMDGFDQRSLAHLHQTG